MCSLTLSAPVMITNLIEQLHNLTPPFFGKGTRRKPASKHFPLGNTQKGILNRLTLGRFVVNNLTVLAFVQNVNGHLSQLPCNKLYIDITLILCCFLSLNLDNHFHTL